MPSFPSRYADLRQAKPVICLERGSRLCRTNASPPTGYERTNTVYV